MNRTCSSVLLAASVTTAWGASALSSSPATSPAVGLAGITVTPHVRAESMRYRREPAADLAARVQLFLRNGTDRTVVVKADDPIRFDGQAPAELLERGEWAWHDTPAAWPGQDLTLPPGALTVWTFNGKTNRWGPGHEFTLDLPGADRDAAARLTVPLRTPRVWLSAVTFLGPTNVAQPEALVLHVANASDRSWRLRSLRLWLPQPGREWRALRPGPWLTNFAAFPADALIPAGDKGVAQVSTGPLPLTYTAVEVSIAAAGEELSLWAHLRIKREAFDISGGWVGGNVGKQNVLTFEPYLKTLRRLHVNTGHLAATPGYTDNDQLYGRYPLKYFHKLQPFDVYDTDAMLSRIHAVEFLGEPQYGGGRPVAPQEVWRQLAPYAATRLATTVTHSEERVWRYYAGLSDFAHYDAYRVSAPSPDAWRRYERWGENVRLGWGAPLETIGDMCRSLRELYRPAPTAYWSQGPHAGWDIYDGRRRTSPTPGELRLQAYHALGSRITSLYWFNLSLKSLVKFRDTLDELGRVGREIRLLEDFYLEGDAYRYQQTQRDGRLDWDLASIGSPRGAVLIALDLDYQPDLKEKVFRFGPPRSARWSFALPAYLRPAADVFRIDADGVRDVSHRVTERGVELSDQASRVAIYVATRDPALRARLEQKRQALLAYEQAFAFDPGRNDADFDALKTFLDAK